MESQARVFILKLEQSLTFSFDKAVLLCFCFLSGNIKKDLGEKARLGSNDELVTNKEEAELVELHQSKCQNG